jgi:CIC family chloride channel protein
MKIEIKKWFRKPGKKGTVNSFKYNDITEKEIGTTNWTRIWFSLFIGLVCGFVGVLFKSTVVYLGRFTYLAAIGDKTAYYSLPIWSILIFLPLVTLISSWIVSRFAPEAAGTGSSSYINAFHFKNAIIKPVTTVVKFFASSSILGCGTSGGFEGPIVLIGSGTGSWLSRKFNFTKKDSHIYMVTGAAAGIASVFQAPLGGALTSIEMLYREDYETRALVPALLASVTGFFVATSLNSSSFIIQNLSYNFYGIQEIPAYIILTFLCSGAGWALVKVFDIFKEAAEKSPIPNFLFPFFGAIAVALLGLMFPQVLGPRFSILMDVLRDRPGIIIILAIFAAKFAATCFAIGTGGSGGVFGPSLLIGGLLGIASSYFLTAINFPFPVPEPEAMMLVAMAGFFAAVSKAPFGSVIMVCEIGGTFHLLPPLLIVCLTTIVLTKSFTIYKTQVEIYGRQNSC